MTLQDEEGWRRLDPRILLIDPVRQGGRLLLPILIAAVGIGRSDGPGGVLFGVLVLAVAIVAGVVPWATTRWRIGDGRLVWRRRFIGQRLVTVSLDRVRSVDLEATLFHRVLGLSKVNIGTGVDDERITLDSLAEAEAQELRTWLLERSRAATAPTPTAPSYDDQGEPPAVAPAPEVLAELDWSWVRYAPLSLGRLAVVAAAFGIVLQLGDDIGVDVGRLAEGAYDEMVRLGVLVVAVVLVVGGTLSWVALACVGYVLQWGGLVVGREGGAVHVRAGLLTTRSTTVEEARVRGVVLVEPALMRLARGAELNALSTGVGSGGTTKVLPPCPRTVAEQVGDRLLGVAGALGTTLVAHGPAARRRRWVRGVGPTSVLGAAIAVLVLLEVVAPWGLLVAVVLPVLGAGLAESSYRHLGHRLTDTHLVVGGGLLDRRRTVLERDGVIGWVLTQTWFQRRVGLATLVATTAAGSESVSVVDVSLPTATALAAQATPEVVLAFAA